MSNPNKNETPPANEVIEAAVQRLVEDYQVPLDEARRICQTISVCSASDLMARCKNAITVPEVTPPRPIDAFDYYTRISIAFEILKQLGQQVPALNQAHSSIQDDIRGIQAQCLNAQAPQEQVQEILTVLRKVLGATPFPP